MQDRNHVQPRRVVLIDGDPYWPLLEFFRNHHFSLSTETAYAQSVRLLLIHMQAKADEFAFSYASKAAYFRSFANDLRFGTIAHDAEDDPSGLFWLPKSLSRTKRLLSLVESFSDWLVNEYATRPLNPWREATLSERLIALRRWQKHIKAKSLLSHIKSREAALKRLGLRREANPIEAPPLRYNALKRMPDDIFEELMTRGFLRPGHENDRSYHRRYNLVGQMVATLLYGGGLRISEAFHCFVSDVKPDPRDPRQAVVSIGHPTEAVMDYRCKHTGQNIRSTRIEYLQTQFGIKPLTLTGKSGWKNNVVDENYYMPVFWAQL